MDEQKMDGIAYYANGEIIPDRMEFLYSSPLGDGDIKYKEHPSQEFGYEQGTFNGVAFEYGPTNWGGNESYFFLEVGSVRIVSRNRAGYAWRPEDIKQIRAEVARLQAG